LLGKRGGVRPYGRRGGVRPYGRRGRRLVGGAAAAGTPNIGAAAVVPHGGSSGPRRAQSLPSWPTAVGCRGPRSPQRTVGGPLAVVGHGGWLLNLQKLQTVV
jgi:hypothetical protein